MNESTEIKEIKETEDIDNKISTCHLNGGCDKYLDLRIKCYDDHIVTQQCRRCQRLKKE